MLGSGAGDKVELLENLPLQGSLQAAVKAMPRASCAVPIAQPTVPTGSASRTSSQRLPLPLRVRYSLHVVKGYGGTGVERTNSVDESLPPIVSSEQLQGEPMRFFARLGTLNSSNPPYLPPLQPLHASSVPLFPPSPSFPPIPTSRPLLQPLSSLTSLCARLRPSPPPSAQNYK